MLIWCGSSKGALRAPFYQLSTSMFCKESPPPATNGQNKKLYVSPSSYIPPQTENASRAGFHEFAETGFAEDRKSETAEGAKSHRHRCKLGHWPIHRARARPCGRWRLHQLCRWRRQGTGDGR